MTELLQLKHPGSTTDMNTPWTAFDICEGIFALVYRRSFTFRFRGLRRWGLGRRLYRLWLEGPSIEA